MKVNMDFNNFDKMCLNSLWLKLVASYAISQGFTSQMKRIVTHAFLSPFLSLTEQFVVGAGKQSKQNPTESRECNLPAFFYRLFASLHCRKHTLPVPTTSPQPPQKIFMRIVFYLRLCEGADVTRNDSQRWFSPHHSAVTILRYCLQLFHNCSNTVGLNY